MLMFLQNIGANTELAHSLAMCLRLVIAAVCGAAIGIERKKNFKDAGLRTHILVCCGAAMFMVISKYGFSDMVGPDGMLFAGTGTADPARIAAQVVSGIGFLGAGVIFKNGVTIKGLTTAAGLWMTAGVGMAIGSGLLIIGIFAAVFVMILQFAMHKKTIGIDSYVTIKLHMTVTDRKDASRILSELRHEAGAVVSSTKITKDQEDMIDYLWTLKVPSDISYDSLAKFIDDHAEITGVDILS